MAAPGDTEHSVAGPGTTPAETVRFPPSLHDTSPCSPTAAPQDQKCFPFPLVTALWPHLSQRGGHGFKSPSSTEARGQGDFSSPSRFPRFMILKPRAPQAAHKLGARTTSFPARGSQLHLARIPGSRSSSSRLQGLAEAESALDPHRGSFTNTADTESLRILNP